VFPYLLPVFPEVDHEVDFEVDVVDERDGDEEDGEDPHVLIHHVVQEPVVGFRIFNLRFCFCFGHFDSNFDFDVSLLEYFCKQLSGSFTCEHQRETA
jgi:hypothetical protein